MPDKTKKTPMGNIMIWGVLSLGVTFLLSYNSIRETILPFSFDERWLLISDLSLSTYNESWVQFIIFTLIQNISVIIFAIVLFVMFLKQSKFFPRTLVGFFMYRILALTILFYLQTVIRGPQSPTLMEIAGDALSALIIPALWIPYILLSENIRERFIY